MNEARATSGRLGLLLALALAVNLALAAVWAAQVGRVIAASTPPFDFPALHSGWTLALERPGARLYDFAAQGERQRRQLGFDAYAAGVLPFVHPPHAALALAPLGWLSLRAAYLVWTAVQLALLAVLAWQVQRLFPHRAPPARLLATSVALAFPPCAISIWFGQVSLLMLVAFVALALALRRPEEEGAWGGALALLAITFKPQLLVFPLLAAALLGRWRTLGRFGLLLAVAVAVSAAALGPGAWPAFMSAGVRMLSLSNEAGLPVQAMDNLRGLLTRALGDGARGAVVTASALGLVAAAAGLVALARRPFADQRARAAALTALAAWAAPFFSPHLFVQDDVIYLLPVALLADRLADGPRGRIAVALLAAWPVLFQAAMPLRATPVLAVALGALAIAAAMTSPPPPITSPGRSPPAG